VTVDVETTEVLSCLSTCGRRVEGALVVAVAESLVEVVEILNWIMEVFPRCRPVENHQDGTLVVETETTHHHLPL